MRFLRTAAPTLALLAVIVPLTPMMPSTAPVAAAGAGQQVALGTVLSADASQSTSGDYATDTYGDPWDFNNDADVVPIPGVGAYQSDSASVANGLLTAATRDGARIRLLTNWSMESSVLPSGHDGWAHPIDGDRYTQTTFRARADQTMNMSVRWWNAAGQVGVIPFTLLGGDWQTFHFDLTNRSNYPFAGSDAVWAGPIVAFELFRAPVGGNPSINLQLDWVRVHRADASQQPPANLPVPQVISPSERGGADYATVERGNPWDFHAMDDVGETHDVANLAINSDGDLTGVTTGNDPYIGLPLGPTLNTDRYHHLTIDVCYGGGFGLNDVAGGGMVGRISWIPHNTLSWVSSQDFIVFPGCQTISLDMVTKSPGSINDESTDRPTGWRGVRIDRLRFDLTEDRGARQFTLKNVTLTDDSAFPSSFPITYRDAAHVAGATADIFVSPTPGSTTGTRIAHGVPVTGDVNTFTWNGNDDTGHVVPNGTYWVSVMMHDPQGVGVGFATGTLRIERPVPSSPSYFVPLTPARLLDTRSGIGGNIFPLAEDTLTELPVTGVGGVPYGDVTAVVLNVTVTNATGDGYVTAWPSGEARPLVSNINFVPGQTVPNLVTVKVGANGRVNLYNSAGSSDLIADVAGYYTTTQPQAGGRFTAVTPSRLLDTRDGTGVGGVPSPLGLNGQIDLGVVGVGGVPASGVTAVALNVTVDQPTGTGFLTVWPAGEPRPTASTHNFVPTLTVANLVLAKVGAGGKVSIYNSAGETQVVADVVGYFSATGGLFVPVTPRRLVDTRDGTGSPVAAVAAPTARTLAMTTGDPVPSAARAVVVNVTSVDSSTRSFVTVWPSGSGMPLASTLNPRPGVAVPNLAYLKLGNGGGLDAFSNASTNVVVDVFGYVTG